MRFEQNQVLTNNRHHITMYWRILGVQRNYFSHLALITNVISTLRP